MKKSALLAAVSLAFLCQGAMAATYNFVSLIDGPGYGTFSGTLGNGAPDAGTPTGEAGYSSFTWTVDSLALTAEAVGDADSDTFGDFAYLDGGSAGLGVCGTLNSANQCIPSSDDNVTVGETLKLSFLGAVDVAVDDLIFRAANHAIIANNSTLASVMVSIDGAAASSISSLVGSIMNGSVFEFSTTTDAQQFYISSLTATPLPAAFLLFGAGLLGLFGAGRARSKQAS